MQEIAFLVEPHLPDDSLGFKINGVQYSLSSPEVSVFGDTVLFEPSEPFGEGIVRVRVLGKTLEFKIDSTPPMMYPMFPADRAMVRGGESFEVVYNIHERAMESGVDSSSISIAVFINGIPHGAYDIDDASVMYRGRALYFYPATAGITFMPGDSVMLLIAASDRTSLYYCGPNSRVEDLRFYIIDPNDTRSIRGTVVDGSTDDPLPGMKIKLYHYLGAYRPIPDITATTDASGSFIITDVPPGIYTLGAFDESDTYQPVFYLDRADYLEADPIPVDHTCPDTIVLATLHMIETPSGGRTCSIAGNVSEEGGDPVSAAYVVAISSEDDEIKGTGMTNPSGDYNLNVLSGDYYVLAFHGSYIPTFYGGSIDWTTAELVAAMNDVDSIDIELKAMSSGGGRSRIQGYVYADSGDDKSSSSVPLRGVRLYVIDSESGEPIAYDVSENNGSFCLDELQPGTYMLKADKPGYMSPTSYCEFTVNEDTSFVNIEMFSTTPVSENSGKQLPAELSISVSPNPFNSAVTLELEGVGATVRSPEQIAVEIFDINGRLVGNLSPSSAETAGFSEDPTPVVWQPDESITSGVYLIRARVGNAEATKKVVYLK